MPTDARKGAVVRVSIDVLHDLLKLPGDIRISRIISEFDDDMHSEIRILLTGNGLTSEVFNIDEGSSPHEATLSYERQGREVIFKGVYPW